MKYSIIVEVFETDREWMGDRAIRRATVISKSNAEAIAEHIIEKIR